MAIIKAVRAHGSTKKIINYVLREEKTKGKYISAINCQANTAAEEMKVTKQMYGKEGGVQYYHFIQSFPPSEQISPKEANTIAQELASERWSDYEMVIATHVDRDHIHSHIIVNSVSLETGKKLHFSPLDLKDIKERNIEMCQERGLSIPLKGRSITANKPEKYMALLRATEGHYKSYVLDTALAVTDAREKAGSREEFISRMHNLGYRTTWTDSRRNITFMDLEGRKVRNSNLTKTFKHDFSKEALEHEFRRNQERTAKQDGNRRSISQTTHYLHNEGEEKTARSIQRSISELEHRGQDFAPKGRAR